MKIVICYFSGTGNTQRVAQQFSESFAQLGNEVQTFSIEGMTLCKSLPDDILKQIADCDLFGIGYPVYAFNAPPIALQFAKRLPRSVSAKRTFVFNTSGEPLKLNNISSLKLRALLKRKRFVVSNEYHYCMPYNIMFRHSDEMAHKMWDTAQKLIPLDSKQIVDGQQHLLKRVFCGHFVAWVMRCEQWGGQLNGRMYKVSKECVHCNMCVNNCPTHNIRVTKKGKFRFGGKCLMCMRCAHLCPKNAMKIGLFNRWKVNGPYTFAQPKTDSEKQRYNKMLTNSYKKYFDEAEQRLKNN